MENTVSPSVAVENISFLNTIELDLWETWDPLHNKSDAYYVSSKNSSASDHGFHGFDPSSPLWILKGLFMAALIALTIVGNLLVIVGIVCSPRLRSPSYFLIGNLAVADLLLGVAVLPISAARELFDFQLSPYKCAAWSSLDVLCCTASILSLVALAAERYVGVSRPLRRARVLGAPGARAALLAAPWAVGLAVALPAPLLLPPQDICLGVNKHLGYVIFSALGSFYLPGVVLLALWWRVYRAASRRSARLEGGNLPTTGLTTLRAHRGGKLQSQMSEDWCRGSRRCSDWSLGRQKSSFNLHSITSFRGRLTRSCSTPDEQALGLKPLNRCSIHTRCPEREDHKQKCPKSEESGKSCTNPEHKLKPCSQSNSCKCTADDDKAPGHECCSTLKRNIGVCRCAQGHTKDTTTTTNGDSNQAESKKSEDTASCSFRGRCSSVRVRAKPPRPVLVKQNSVCSMRTSSARPKDFTVEVECTCRGLQLGRVRNNLKGSARHRLDQNKFRCSQSCAQNLSGCAPARMRSSASTASFGRGSFRRHGDCSGEDGRCPGTPNCAVKRFAFSCRQSSSIRSVLGSKQIRLSGSHSRAARTLALVVGGFLLCWFPFFILLPIDAACSSCNVGTAFTVSFWLGYFNSCINPFIYACSSRDMRRAFRCIVRRREGW